MKYWQQRAKTNIETIEHLTSMPQFQSLTKLLLANRGHRTGADVLIAFNQEMASKNKLIAEWRTRPNGFYACLDHMQKTYGKSITTWHHWKYVLSAIGLLYVRETCIRWRDEPCIKALKGLAAVADYGAVID